MQGRLILLYTFLLYTSLQVFVLQRDPFRGR